MQAKKSQDNASPVYPIRTVADLTGVNPVTLRAWERRYDLLKPARTEKGHRLYSTEDVELVHRILELLDQGIPVGQLSAVLQAPSPVALPHDTSSADEDPWHIHRTGMLADLRRMDEVTLDKRYNELLALYPYELVLQRVILPLLQTLPRRAGADPTELATTSLFRFFLRNKLGARFLHERANARGPRVLITSLADERDDLIILAVGLFACANGYRVTGLEPLPGLEHLVPATELLGTAVVVLIGSQLPDLDGCSRQLGTLDALIPTPLVLYSTAPKPRGASVVAPRGMLLTGPELQPLLAALRAVVTKYIGPSESGSS